LLTPEMHAVMAGVINLARRQLIANSPKEGEWLPTTARAVKESG
jgi:hypothetical protein